MIPQFPEFKKLELGDKDEVNSLIGMYPSYSDFNFAGTWSWDVRDKMQISVLNGNYVIRFIDYVTGTPFYTFLGERYVNESVQTLLDLCASLDLTPEIKLMAIEVVNHIDKTKFLVEEDRDNFDYIYSTKEIATLAGGGFKNKRNQISSFLREYPNAQAEVIDISHPDIQSKILQLFDRWVKEKMEKDSDFELQEEIIVIRKIFSATSEFNFFTTGVFIDGDLVGFCINELKADKNAVAHVAKAALFAKGLATFLFHKNSEQLELAGYDYLNYEQDLGMENLRTAKMQFRPLTFLKKYKVGFLE